MILRNDLGKFYKCQIHVFSAFLSSRDKDIEKHKLFTSYDCNMYFARNFSDARAMLRFPCKNLKVSHIRSTYTAYHQIYDNTHYCEQLVVACGPEYKNAWFR